jgi:hypothetical protein
MNVDTAFSHDDVRLDVGHGNELLQSDEGQCDGDVAGTATGSMPVTVEVLPLAVGDS